MGVSQDSTHTDTVSFRVDPATKHALRAVAARRGELLTDYMKAVVREALEREEPLWGPQRRPAGPQR